MELTCRPGSLGTPSGFPGIMIWTSGFWILSQRLEYINLGFKRVYPFQVSIISALEVYIYTEEACLLRDSIYLLSVIPRIKGEKQQVWLQVLVRRPVFTLSSYHTLKSTSGIQIPTGRRTLWFICSLMSTETTLRGDRTYRHTHFMRTALWLLDHHLLLSTTLLISLQLYLS